MHGYRLLEQVHGDFCQQIDVPYSAPLKRRSLVSCAGNRVEEIYQKPNLSYFSIALVGVLIPQLSFDEQKDSKQK